MADVRIPHIRGSSFSKNEALYDGIRPWMNNAVRNWVTGQVAYNSKTSNGYASTKYRDHFMHEIEMSSRLNFGRVDSGSALWNALINVFNSDELVALDIVQAIVELRTVEAEDAVYPPVRKSLQDLNGILHKSGSKWHIEIDGDHARLEARVDQTTELAYKKLISNQDDFSSLLKTAWEYCYGRGPNASETYSYSIKAVEAASWNVVTPNNPSSTLGTILKDLKAQADAEKFTTIFKDKEENESIEMIIKMMGRLWHGQTDRHATGAYTQPSVQEAEVAVHLALTLCYLFSTGSVVRHTSSAPVA